MNVYYCSDLHLEHKNYKLDLQSKVVNPNSDILILAGDIGCIKDLDFYGDWLKSLCGRFYTVVYLLGNHEWYGLKYDSDISNLIASSRFENLIYVPENSYIELDGINIICSTLWSSLNNNNFITARIISEHVNDFKYIQGLTTDLCFNLYNSGYNFILDRVINSIQNNKQFIIATHFPPITTSDKLTEIGYYFYNTSYADLVNEPKINLDIFDKLFLGWIYGHSHKPLLTNYDKYKIFTNQCGYNINRNFKLESIKV